MQRSNRSSSIVAASKIIRNGDTVWTPPKAKDREGNEIDDDDITFVRNLRGQTQSLKHSAVLGSMDLIVDGDGFLIPRKCKKGIDDTTVDNEVCLYDDDKSESESESGSSDEQSTSEEETTDPNEASMSSIPYCRLVPDSFEMEPAPQTPSGHGSKNSKSFGTLETEAMTRTTSDSRSDMFASPRSFTQRSSWDKSFQSPHLSIPPSFEINSGLDLMSPLPNPSPAGSTEKSNRKIGKNLKTPPYTQKERSKSDTFYIPGITATARSSSKLSVDSRASTSTIGTPMSPQKKAVLSSPVISTSRVSSLRKNTNQHSYRSPSQQPRNSLRRNRSDSTADHVQSSQKYSPLLRGVTRVQSDSTKEGERNYGGARRTSKYGRDRHYVPGNNDDALFASPNVSSRTASENAAPSFKSPIKTPSSSSRDTSITTLITLSSSTGRETIDTFPSLETDPMEPLERASSDNGGHCRRKDDSSNVTKTTISMEVDLNQHFQHENISSSNSLPQRNKRRSHQTDGMLRQIQALMLDDDENDCLDEEASEAGAVIVPTRKVFKTQSFRRRSNHRSSSQPRSRRDMKQK